MASSIGSQIRSGKLSLGVVKVEGGYSLCGYNMETFASKNFKTVYETLKEANQVGMEKFGSKPFSLNHHAKCGRKKTVAA